MRKKIQGGILVTIGYILSPLSWWNDLLINIPLAYVFALPFGLISNSLFTPMIIVGYWLTNVLGFMLLHKGAHDLAVKHPKPYTKQALSRDVLVSIVYTGIVAVLAWQGWLQFPEELLSSL